VWVPLTIFGLTYLVIAGQRIPGVRLDRPSGALCGAVLMVVTGRLTLPEAYAAINLDTLSLLLGMMVLSAYLMEAAFFRSLARFTVTRAGTARTLLVGLVFMAGGLSAILVNDVVCLMFTPIVVAVVREMRLPPLPYLLALTSAANIGGVVTLAGNPQNMIIATSSGLGYARYALRMAPVGVLGLIVDAALLLWMFRRELPPGWLPRPHVEPPPVDRRLMIKSLAVLALVVGGFLSGRSLAGMALLGAAVLTLIARAAPRPVFARIDGALLLFFAGLFVVVEGAARTGILDRAHSAILPLLGGSPGRQLVTFGLFTEIASNLLSNVPFVLVARAWVPHLALPEYQWTGLAMTSTLAGNLTLVGSVANLIVFELAGPEGRVGFLRFLRHGAIITVATTAIGFAVLLLEMSWGL
jgi:Na+/H+ antiporter NhaD/arsenite permease-like protein